MKRKLIVLVIGLSLTASCSQAQGTQSAQRSARAPERKPDLSVLQFSHGNYVTFDTPGRFTKDTAGRGGIVISGVVEGFDRGRRLFSFDDEPMNRVVMQVRVNETVTGDRKYVYGGRAYVELWGGIGWQDPAPRFRDAIPAGTPVAVFGASKFAPSDSRTQGADDGHPKGTRTLSATHPQRLVFEETTTAGPRLVAKSPLSEFGPAWANTTTLTEFVERMKQDLRS